MAPTSLAMPLVGAAVGLVALWWFARKPALPANHTPSMGDLGVVQTNGMPRTAPFVDLQRYAGMWHEIARFPNRFEEGCVTQPVARYLPRADGIEVLNRCQAANGRLRVSRGFARVVKGSGDAKLKVTFAPQWLRWLPLVWANYWILHVDDDYGAALVGDPARKYLWVLAREIELPRDTYQRLTEIAGREGYDVQRLAPS